MRFSSEEINSKQLVALLRSRFGYNEFRGHQEAIIGSILSKKDVVVIMPTGAGKSLCYQLPSLLSEGVILVISPLIALMKNQIDQLTARGISAYFLNSTLSRKENAYIKEQATKGEVRLLYTAPESLSKEENLPFFKSLNLSYVAIDEAHCISEWGHDFRPEYRRIREVINAIGRVPLVAVTATATPKVQLDIKKNLDIQEAIVYKSSFNRPNLFYEVQTKIDVRKALLSFLRKHKNEGGIIYCLTRKKVEELWEWLVTNDVSATYYHAGLDAKQRVRHQDAFLQNEKRIIVATVAFGMGIDKADVRFVVHYSPPKSLEGYYQETGRAGRDGAPAHCLMFYSLSDLERIRKLNKNKPTAEQDNIQLLLREVTAYAISPTCRRKQLLFYFGEALGESTNCGTCDNCVGVPASFEAQKHLALLLEAIEQTKPRHSLAHIVHVLMGKETDCVEQFGSAQLDVFGKGKHESEGFWDCLLRQAIYDGLATRKIDFCTLEETLGLTKKGTQFLGKQSSIKMRRPHPYDRRLSEETEEGILHERGKRNGPKPTHDAVLFSKLAEKRTKLVKEHKLPPYVIMSDHSLEEMSRHYPTNEEQMLQIAGINKKKMNRWGKPFLALIKEYTHMHEDIVSNENVLIKSNGSRSRLKISIIRQIDKQEPLEDIADSLGIRLEELIEQMEGICHSGTSLNVSYLINCMLSGEQQEEIQRYLRKDTKDDLRAAFEDLNEYTQEEIRLMRIKFISTWGY